MVRLKDCVEPMKKIFCTNNKHLTAICAVVGTFLIPNGSFGIWIALFIKLAFIIIQMTLFVDFSHSWAELWVSKYQETKSKEWRCVLVAFTLLNYALAIAAIVFLFVKYSPVLWAFILLNFVLCIIVSAMSILPAVQEELPKSGLLQSSVVTLHVIYLTWSAVAFGANLGNNQPGKSGTFFDTQTIIGTVIWILRMLYSSQPIASVSNKMMFSLLLRICLNNWYQSNPSLNTLNASTAPMWEKVIASWICLAVYVWTLVSPILLPQRDFSQTTHRTSLS